MASLSHTISHHFHGAARVQIFDHEDAILVRLYPVGKNPVLSPVDIFFHGATDELIAAFYALKAALAAQDVVAKEEV